MEAAAPSCFDMEGLGRPRVTDAHVASFVKEKFGLPITDIKALAGERDLNYRATAGGKPYVIKVANASEVYGQLECENQVMVHVAKQLELDDTLTEALLTPRPLELSDGSGTIGKISSQAGPATEYLIRVLTFIEGDMWSGTTLAVDFLASLGRTAAALDKAMLSFSHPNADRDHAWNLGSCRKHVTMYLDDIAANTDPSLVHGENGHLDDRELVLDFLALHEYFVAPAHAGARPPTLPRSVVHLDLNDNNVVCAEGRVSGVIDFGDMCRTETVNNLAVALAYAFFGASDPLAVISMMVSGYTSRRKLSQDELRCLFPLACMRVCTTCVMAAHSVKLDPANAAYLTISQKPAWEALRKLRSVDPRTAADVALEAGGLAWREINQIAEKLRRAGAYDKVDEPKAPGKFMMSVEGSKDAMWPPPAPEPPTVLGKKSKGTIDGGGVQG